MTLELQGKELCSFVQPMIQKGHYYAVGYQKSYYFGRALGDPMGFSSTLHFSTQATLMEQGTLIGQGMTTPIILIN